MTIADTHSYVETRMMVQLLDALKECSDELEVRVEGENPERARYDVQMRRYLRDMAPVVAARLLLKQMRDDDGG